MQKFNVDVIIFFHKDEGNSKCRGIARETTYYYFDDVRIFIFAFTRGNGPWTWDTDLPRTRLPRMVDRHARLLLNYFNIPPGLRATFTVAPVPGLPRTRSGTSSSSRSSPSPHCVTRILFKEDEINRGAHLTMVDGWERRGDYLSGLFRGKQARVRASSCRRG